MIDLLIQSATVIDGTGAPAFVASVGVSEGRIAHIGNPVHASSTIDASGLTLAPGFIDVHTHDDISLIATPEMQTKVKQGVTTVITGLCGYSAAPFPPDCVPPQEYAILLRDAADCFETFASYLAAVADAAPAVNYLPLVGHSTLRIAAMDGLDRPATEAEIETMGALMDEALDAGAAGLSTGLAYAMAIAAPEAEVVALCKRMAPWGLHVTHIRNEADALLEAVAETLRIGQQAGVGTVFSHHKAIGLANWGLTADSLALIDAARGSQEVALDAYPYAFSSTSLTPERVARGGRVTITRSEPHPEMAGRDLSEIAAEMGLSEADATKRLMPAGALFHGMSEGDVQQVLSHPCCMIGSDGLPFDPMPHPRLTGSFPRILGRYVREEAVLKLPEAVRRMTALPAEVFGLTGRGKIAEGYVADLVLFNADTVGDPDDVPVGIEAVFVAGETPRRGMGQLLNTARRS